MTRFRTAGRTALAIAAVLLGTAIAHAEMWNNPNVPHSPYALPAPVSHAPDLDDLIEGNGKPHFSGQWRHWGDGRNGGEIAQMLLAPDQAFGHRTVNGLPESRYCNDFPDRC